MICEGPIASFILLACLQQNFDKQFHKTHRERKAVIKLEIFLKNLGKTKVNFNSTTN